MIPHLPRFHIETLAIIAAAIVIGCGPDVYTPGEIPSSMIQLGKGESSVVLVGDIMTWDRTREHLEREGAGYPFKATKAILSSADFTVGNLEGPVVEKGKKRKGKFRYKVPPWTLAGLSKTGGFDLLSLANNHVTDCGRKGLLETISNVERAGMRTFGVGANLKEAQRPFVVQIGEAKVAFLSFLSPETHVYELEDLAKPGYRERVEAGLRKTMGAGKKKAGAAITDANTVSRLVEEAKKTADIVIVYFHWGIRYHRDPTEHQRTVGRMAAESGADLIVGHHAHFWQPVGMVGKTPVVYGVGNFAFGSGNSRADEGILVRAVLEAKRLSRVELFPLYIKNRDRKVDYQTKVMKGKDADSLLGRIAAESAQHGAKLEVRGGMGYISIP